MVMELNKIYHGFRLLKTTKIKEVNSTAYEFTHEKSGARLLFLENKDDNKVFSISFRTPPKDDTGVAHIVEHSTLCGSRKFPLKEPFVELVKGSLNTFLNAMTYPDKTMYPVASQNDKDFQNLMDVYLDAVFYPVMYTTPEVLMQEGWHYEIEKPADDLEYSGVVYNEMKGALSSPEDILDSKSMNSLFPDTTYGFESGGDPEAIPQLTQQMFIDFHEKYYHPSNSYIYLYGDMDIDEKLAFLDKEYLQSFSRIAVPSKIMKQPQFKEHKVIYGEYPIGAEEAAEDKTFLSLNAIVGEATEVETMLALEILEHALLKTQAAPLRKALIDAKIGKDVQSSFEDGILQPFFSIIINGAEADRAEKFRTVVRDTLQKLVQDGIDRELMEASINLLEFKLREADFGQYPKGLVYNIKIMNSWLYDKDPTIFLYYEELMQKMKDGLENGYFEKVLKERFLDNPHMTLLVLSPNKELAAEKAAALQKVLAIKKEQLSTGELDHIIEMTAALKQRQQREDSSEALEKIPLLKLSDIRKTVSNLIIEERVINNMKVLFHDVVTNEIIYEKFYFNADAVPENLLPYAFLLTELIGKVNTKKHTYAELANLVNLHTGGISYDLVGYAAMGQPDSLLPKFKIKAKALASKLPQMHELLAEILTMSRFDDKKRVLELVEQCRSGMETNVLRAAQQVVASRLISYTSRSGMYNEQGSLTFYWFIKDFSENFDEKYEEMQRAFARLLPILCNRRGLIVSVTTEARSYNAFVDDFKIFQAKLSSENFPVQVYDFALKKANEGFMTSSRVQYVCKGANFLKLGYEYTGAMRVLETILRYDYFWTRIRVQGGAYGAFTQFNRNGAMLFGSYRDPNLAETFNVYDETAAYLQRFSVSEREMDKYIIGTISGIDTPLTSQMKGELAAECYIRSITQTDRQKARDEILATRQHDIIALSELISACMKENTVCVLGNEVKIKENEELFSKLTNIFA